MQLLPPLTQDPRIIARETPAGVHLPYARHVDDTTLATRDGLLLQTIRLSGLLFETADTDELNYRADLRDAMLRALGSSRFALWHHVVRRKAEGALDARFPDSFSRELDARWRARLAAREMYVNDLFLTIVRRPIPGRIGTLDRLRRFLLPDTVDTEALLGSELRALRAASDTLVAALSAYGAKRLGARAQGRSRWGI